MAKLRFTNLDAEIEGDPKEIAVILREFSAQDREHQATAPLAQSPKRYASSKLPDGKLPSTSEIIKMIETAGKPYTLSLVEQQKKILGRPINSRNERALYARFYSLHKRAMEVIIKRHGGHWDSKMEVIDGLQSKRFTLITDEESKPLEASP